MSYEPDALLDTFRMNRASSSCLVILQHSCRVFEDLCCPRSSAVLWAVVPQGYSGPQ